jgi:cysteine desulfurase
MTETYMDCNATSPVEPKVAGEVMLYLTEEYGNAGSRTHDFGARAKSAVATARGRVAALAGAEDDEVVFTSGATESNNLAILGLAEYGEQTGRKHIVSTMIEHKAVLEPLEVLRARGFEVSLVHPSAGGFVQPGDVQRDLRGDTLLVSVMHVNNETGIEQPITEIAQSLAGSDAFLHVDAAQGFGKVPLVLKNSRIDLMSVSAHKLYGPKGVGALIARRRDYQAPPLCPLLHGGGQERGLRAGTLPVELIVGFGVACDLARQEVAQRRERCDEIRRGLLRLVERLGGVLNGNEDRCMTHVLNISFPGVDSEAAIVSLKGLVAVSNGSACTSASYTPSHVLTAMGLDSERAEQALRFSWCHMTEEPDWDIVYERLRKVQQS